MNRFRFATCSIMLVTAVQCSKAPAPPENDADRASNGAERSTEKVVYQGKTLQQWVRELTAENNSDVVADLLSNRAAVQAFGAVLKDEDPGPAGSAAFVLGFIGPPAVPVLAEALKNKAERVRMMASMALCGIGPEARAAVPALIGALKDQNNHVRDGAAQALGEIGPEAKVAIPALIETLKDDKDANTRFLAAGALGAIGPEDEAAVAALVEGLKDKVWYVRERTARALCAIGLAAKTAVPQLIVALRDEERMLRYSAARALEQIGPEAKAAVPALIEALEDENVGVCCAAADALGAIGPDAKAAAPALSKRLKDATDDVIDDDLVRHATKKALEKIKGESGN